MPEGGFENEEINPFHYTIHVENEVHGGSQNRLVRAFELNCGGIKIEVTNFYGKMHSKDYFDREDNSETYFEWKPMADERK